MALNDTKVLGAEAPAVEAVEEVKATVEAPAQEVAEDFDPAILGTHSDKMGLRCSYHR